jgi:hypothetical protein
MAKKKLKPAKKAAAKKPTPRPLKAAAKGPPRGPDKSTPPAADQQALVLYELQGLAGIRFHSDHDEVVQARRAAAMLVNSPDVAHAWVLRNVEIVRGAE